MEINYDVKAYRTKLSLNHSGILKVFYRHLEMFNISSSPTAYQNKLYLQRQDLKGKWIRGRITGLYVNPTRSSIEVGVRFSLIFFRCGSGWVYFFRAQVDFEFGFDSCKYGLGNHFFKRKSKTFFREKFLLEYKRLYIGLFFYIKK